LRILITNDDGIHAPGLAILETIARQLTEDIWIVAPEVDQSGTSHSLTLNDPIRVRQIARQHYAVKGTPTDCVIMGVRHLIPDRSPDLILSGVNRGQNVAEDVTYSGTIAGAIEGTLLGIPSIALSQAYSAETRDDVRWAVAETLGPGVIRRLLDARIPAGVVMNVNFPDCEPNLVEGIAVTSQGRRNQALLDVDARRDGRGNPYFWLAFHRQSFEPREGTDLWAMRHKQVSVTPLKLDFTDHALMDSLRATLL
jgi:5'/3'-nucleotidase